MVSEFDYICSSGSLSALCGCASRDGFVVLRRRGVAVSDVAGGLARMVRVGNMTGAAMVYSDFFDGQGKHPLIDCQKGALRDDFDFGPVGSRNSVRRLSVCGVLCPASGIVGNAGWDSTCRRTVVPCVCADGRRFPVRLCGSP